MFAMKLKKFFGIATAQDKMDEYNHRREELAELDITGAALAERFTIQKSIYDGIEDLPEENALEVMGKHRRFLKDHQKEVVQAVTKRNRVLKSLESLRNDPMVKDVIKSSEAMEKIENSYQEGLITKGIYHKIIKAMTGKPTRFADMIVFNSKGEVLVLHRVRDYTPQGTVCIPGGHVDEGEGFEDAAIRELKEETNLDPKDVSTVWKLGEHKNKDAHIEYYIAYIDELQPITLDASEHCFAEWVPIQELITRPFIFDQGKIVMGLLSGQFIQPNSMVMKAFVSGKISQEVFSKAVHKCITDKVIEKSMGMENSAPVVPESLEGGKGRKIVKLPVVDPFFKIETIIKGISGCKEVQVNKSKLISFSEPLQVNEVSYKEDPSHGTLTEMEVNFIGDEEGLKTFFETMKESLNLGPVRVRTAHDEFMSANVKENNYIGDPIFSYLEI